MVSGQLKALLGVLAVAGYQNREKIAEFLRGLNAQQSAEANRDEGSASPRSGGGDLLGKLGSGRDSAASDPFSTGSPQEQF